MKIMLNTLLDFLQALNHLNVACKHDIYRKSKNKLAIGSVNKCFALCVEKNLIEGAGGDNRKQNFKLTDKGLKLLDLFTDC